MAQGVLIGTGVIDDPYIIEDALDLSSIRNSGFNAGKYYKLAKDIDLSSDFIEGWTPIPAFNGYIDGNGFRILNLKINGAAANQGLIGTVNGAFQIYNLGFENVDILGTTSVGAIVGTISTNGARIRDCYVLGKLEATATDGMVGALVGSVSGRSNFTIENSYSRANLNARYGFCGGLVGTIVGGSVNRIRGCYFAGTMFNLDFSRSFAMVGGLTTTATMTDCYYNFELIPDVTRPVAQGTALTTSAFTVNAKDSLIGWDTYGSLTGIHSWDFKDGRYPILWYQALGIYFLESEEGLFTIQNNELVAVEELTTLFELGKIGIRKLEDVHVDHIQKLKENSSYVNVVNLLRNDVEFDKREVSLTVNLERGDIQVELTDESEEIDDYIQENEAGKTSIIVVGIDNEVEVEEIDTAVTFEGKHTKTVSNQDILIKADNAYLNENRAVDVFDSINAERPVLENEISDPYAVGIVDSFTERADVVTNLSYETEKVNKPINSKLVAKTDIIVEHEGMSNEIEYRQYGTVNSIPEFALIFEAEALSRYMVSLDNGATWWTIQRNTWIKAKLDDINTLGMPISDINRDAIWRSLRTTSKDEVKIAVGIKNDILNSEHSIRNFIVEFRPNAAPEIEGLQIIENPTSITVDGLINDLENDDIEYRVLIKKAYEEDFFQVTPRNSSGWHKRQNGHKVNHKYDYSNLKTGINEVKVQAKDSRGAETEESVFIVYESGKPQHELININEFNINANLSHTKGKDVAFRILINGVQVAPAKQGFSEFFKTPHNLNYVWDSKDLYIGITNTVRIEVTDVHDNIDVIENTFVGTYKGLLFKNEVGTYYSTDQNEVIHRLDFGTVVGGLDSTPSLIVLDNKCGFAVENVRVWTDEGIPEEKIQLTLSLTGERDSFVPIKEFNIPGVMEHNDEFKFYARVETKVDSISIKDKVFKIYTTGEPVLRS